MKYRKRLWLIAGIGAALLSGCGAHYRGMLKVYQQAEPTVFDQQTLAWTAQAEKAATTTLAITASPALAGQKKTASGDVVFAAVLANVLGGQAEELTARLSAMQSPEGVERRLKDNLVWRNLAIAVAVRNPAIRAARERWQATLNQYSQAEFLDTLIGQFRAFTRYLNVETGKPLNKEMVQRFFPYPSTISLKGELIRQQVQLARLDWERTVRDSLVEAGKIFFDYQYLIRTEKTARENVQLIEDLVGVVDEQYRAGSESQADLLKMQTELERQRNALDDIRSRQRAAVARLNGLLDRSPNKPLGIPQEENLPLVSPELEPLIAEALAGRQEVRAQQARVARSEAAIRMGEVMNRPLFTQGYSLFERGMMPEASESSSRMPYGVMAKTKDRPAYAQAEAYLAEMRRRLEGEQSILEEIRAGTRSMVHTWFEDLDMAQRQVALIQQIVLPQSASAYETTLSGYTGGHASFIDLLDSERGLIKARLELDTAHRDLNRTLVDYAKVAGSFVN